MQEKPVVAFFNSPHTSQVSCSLYDLIDHLKTTQKFCMIVTTYFIPIDKITIKIIQLHVAASHVLPGKMKCEKEKTMIHAAVKSFLLQTCKYHLIDRRVVSVRVFQ